MFRTALFIATSLLILLFDTGCLLASKRLGTDLDESAVIEKKPRIATSGENFYTMTLTYRGNGKTVDLPFSEFRTVNTFDLSDCGKADQYVKITDCLSEFFDNDDVNLKLHILIAPSSWINKFLYAAPPYFAKVMKDYNKAPASIVFCWRWNRENNSFFRYLITESLPQNLTSIYEYWRKSHESGVFEISGSDYPMLFGHVLREMKCFHACPSEPK